MLELSLKTSLRMKCPQCGSWKRIQVNKIFLEQETSELKVKAFIPMYQHLKEETCKKRGSFIAESRELVRILKGESKHRA